MKRGGKSHKKRERLRNNKRRVQLEMKKGIHNPTNEVSLGQFRKSLTPVVSESMFLTACGTFQVVLPEKVQW